MPRSMTGFGRAEDGQENSRLSCEVRSVNHRYLSLKLHLPGILQRLEPWIDKQVRSRAKRGSVDLRLILHSRESSGPSRLDTRVADAYLESLRRYAKQRKLDGDISPDVLVQLPGVLVPPDAEELATALQGRIKRLVGQALDQMKDMREREGARMATAMRRETQTLRRCQAAIAKRAGSVPRDYQKRLRQRLQTLLEGSGATLDEAALAREVAVLADRSDVTEELDRLLSHLTEFDQLLEQSNPVGRSLEFVIQELGREIQTVGSKAQDEKILAQVLRAKAALEKLREQAQNIE